MDLATVMILCPDCGLPMVWMQGKWHCKCQMMELPDVRMEVRLKLYALIELPETVLANSREKFRLAERIIAQHGLQLRDGCGWYYRPAEHACAAWVQNLRPPGWLARSWLELRLVVRAWRRGEGPLSGLLRAWWEIVSGRVDVDTPAMRSVKLW